MDANDLPRQVTIPLPCTADRDAMPGDDRVRFCSVRGMEVHNLEARTQEEATSLIAARGDDLCGRIRRDEDGAILTARGVLSGYEVPPLAKPTIAAEGLW